MTNDDEEIDCLELPWGESGDVMGVFVDPDDGFVIFEFPRIIDTLAMAPDEWLRVLEFVTQQRVRRMS